MKRGEYNALLKLEIRAKILAWVAENGDNQAQCARELGLSKMTVNRHFKEINAEKEQDDERNSHTIND